VETATLRVARRPRSYVSLRGPDAADYLERMVSNAVVALPVGGSCEALLLTAKARVIAPLVVWRRGEDDSLLLTEPELGERVTRELTRFRFAAKVVIEPQEHTSLVVFGAVEGIPARDYGEPAVEVLDADLEGEPMGDDELELMRIRAGTPRMGRELDDRVLPAEAGLTATHVSFTKGCYPGQEPVARLHHRGKANRRLRVLAIQGTEPVPYDAEIKHGDKVVGRVTSTAPEGDGTLSALGYVRVEVPDDARLEVEGRQAEMRPARFELATSASAGQRSIP
jgi:tRNA-modifying protein YgfZ